MVLWASRAGFPYAWDRFRLLTSGADRQASEVMARVWEGPMKRKDVSKIPGALRHASPDQIVKTYPHLAEFMTAAVFDGGKESREAPTITFWCNGGLWRASVKDREESLVLWMSAESPAQLFALLEEFCLNPAAPWRHDDVQHERNGKRTKKGS